MSDERQVSRRAVLGSAAVAGAGLAAGAIIGGVGAASAQEAGARGGDGAMAAGRSPLFTLEADELGAIGSFNEVVGLGSEHELIEHTVQFPSGQQVIKKLPGLLDFTEIKLRRDLSSNMVAADWRKLIENNGVGDARQQASLVLVAPDGTPAARWDLFNCWPSSLAVSLDAAGKALEELTLVCEKVERVAP